jgi:hypothetical protein
LDDARRNIIELQREIVALKEKEKKLANKVKL